MVDNIDMDSNPDDFIKSVMETPKLKSIQNISYQNKQKDELEQLISIIRKDASELIIVNTFVHDNIKINTCFKISIRNVNKSYWTWTNFTL